MGDLYEFAGSGELGLTFCVPLSYSDEFYGALCSDYNISQIPIEFEGVNDENLGIYSKPQVLQRDADKFIESLEQYAQSIDEEEVDNDSFDFKSGWVEHVPITGTIYDDIEIHTG